MDDPTKTTTDPMAMPADTPVASAPPLASAASDAPAPVKPAENETPMVMTPMVDMKADEPVETMAPMTAETPKVVEPFGDSTPPVMPTV